MVGGEIFVSLLEGEDPRFAVLSNPGALRDDKWVMNGVEMFCPHQ